ncbi:MAG TPA: CBS domain-containing protein [Candidatus Caldiarchaeum subterraneum]|uniref:CBS domain-containing protein n=1 Tax=Caldiarchaeum subterraneum TaxID=311458 RepID=A0A832ZWJ0_CALS0|nr:CBS domain-containing protein [Candidatus Caldarchaeum subterraneum]
MRRDFLVLDSSLPVSKAAKAMRDVGYSSALVSEEGRITGIVTERDILYKVVAEERDPREVKLGDVMSKPLITVSPETKVAEAISLMTRKGVRRLAVKKDDAIIGVLSQMTLVGDIVVRAPVMPEIELEKEVSCPYCGAVCPNTEELSKHIDLTHIGRGILSGIT